MFYFLLWCALSTVQVILNKKLLNEFPYPFTLTTCKLGVATLFALLGWIIRFRPFPRKWINQFRQLFPVVFLNALALSLVDYSLFSGTVFVNQAARAAQSSTTLLLTNMPKTIWSMAPLVICFGGIYHATTDSLLDTSFVAGMASNVAFTLRGVFSKRVLWQRATPANNFGVITMLSFLFMVPVAFNMEGDDVKTVFEAASISDKEALLMNLSLSGFVYYLSIEVAYLKFDPKTSPFVRSLEDSIRQAVTMVGSVYYFQEDITRNMAIGCGIALAGQLLQSLDQLSSTSKQLSVKKISPKKSSPKIKKRT